jgi:3-methyl-2-oxobutanoate hydroxymethyltransferase
LVVLEIADYHLESPLASIKQIRVSAFVYYYDFNEKTSIVTFSLGSGRASDVIMSFVADICGENSEEEKPPKHAHAFGNLARLHKQMYEERVAALKEFHSEVTQKNFPYPETNIAMHPNEKEKFLESLVKA